MRFLAATLLTALLLVPSCAKHLNVPNERPDISSTEGNSIAGGEGGSNSSAIIAAIRLLQGRPSNVQHLSEAMLAAIA